MKACDRCAHRGLVCNGEVGEKQSQQDADEQWRQWRLATHNNSQPASKVKWFPQHCKPLQQAAALPDTHEVPGGLENKVEYDQWHGMMRKSYMNGEARSSRMGGTQFIPQTESDTAKSDHVQNLILQATAEIAKPAVMPQSQAKTAGAAAEQALVALASKMAAQQARNEELEAKLAEMEANEKKTRAEAAESAQRKAILEAQAASVLFGKFGGRSPFSKSEDSPRIEERPFVCEELMYDEVVEERRLTRPVPHRPFMVKRPVPVHASFTDAIQIF